MEPTLLINCLKCGKLTPAEIVESTILPTAVISDVECQICESIYVVKQPAEVCMRKYHKGTKQEINGALNELLRPLLDDEHYGTNAGQNEH